MSIGPGPISTDGLWAASSDVALGASPFPFLLLEVLLSAGATGVGADAVDIV